MLLCNLLNSICHWAVEHRVPAESRTWQAAIAELRAPWKSSASLSFTIRGLLKGFPCPIPVLLGQSWLCQPC